MSGSNSIRVCGLAGRLVLARGRSIILSAIPGIPALWPLGILWPSNLIIVQPQRHKQVMASHHGWYQWYATYC